MMLICGAGIVSSTLLGPIIEDILNAAPCDCKLLKGGLGELGDRIDQIDLLLTTVTLPGDMRRVDVPQIDVTGLFSGEKDRIEQEILKKLAEQRS